MTASYHDLWNLLHSDVKIFQNNINRIVKSYSFHHISQNFEIDPKIKLYQRIEESKIIIINQYTCIDKSNDDCYFIIGFQKTIILLDQSCFSFLDKYFNNPDKKIIFLNDSKDIISNKMEIKNKETDFLPKKIESSIIIFSDLFKTEKIINSSIAKLWNEIIPCISNYLIRQSYCKSMKNRINDFLIKNSKSTSTASKSERIFDENEYIELEILGEGSLFRVKLIYDIENEELLALKKPNRYDPETPKLIKREFENYSKLNHSFLPKYIGKTKKNNYLIIEYINGQTLEEIKNDQLTEKDKISIIFELMITIEYFHQKHFVLRDLKPNNVVIDTNKDAVLIDLDRIIQLNEEENGMYTEDFASDYIAPEVCTGNYTYKSDIYSLGKMMYFIMTGQDQGKMILKIDTKYSIIEKMIQKSTLDDVEKRPNISELINDFFMNFNSKIKFIYFNSENGHKELLSINPKNIVDIYNLGINYYFGKGVARDINKAIYYFAIAANYNFPIALCKLARIYLEGNYVKRDVNKAIKFLTIATHQNFEIAQFQLGNIYYQGVYVKQDINKALYYFTLAANQKNPHAQYNLGIIYLEDRYIPIDVEKSIYYLTLSANQNNFMAQNELGHIYRDGIYVKADLKKSFNYFLLAANQNFPEALFYVGLYYEKGIYVSKNINKAIDYYSLASKQNFVFATHNLGNIYDDEYFGLKDNDKAIHYYTIAANQGIDKSQYNLGILYLNEKNVQFDINKAIYYLSLAANQKHYYALFKLGNIYYTGFHVKVDIKKAIDCYLLASDFIDKALLNLSNIFYENKYVKRDMNKVLFYLEKAAKPKPFNNVNAQLKLGFIYYYGKYIASDIHKAIYYYKLAAKQNNNKAQFSLGVIYEFNNKILKDFNQCIYYYTLASNQNHPKAQVNLGFIYFYGKNIEYDINKAIYYFTLSANQKCKEALFMLGFIYFEKFLINSDSLDCENEKIETNESKLDFNEHKKRKLIINNISDKKVEIQNNYNNNKSSIKQNEFNDNDKLLEKAIHYFSLSADLNYGEAQYFLGKIYIEEKYGKNNINKGKRLLIKATLNKEIKAYFYLGFMYHVGENMPRNINKAIELYKEASSFSNQYAKNNLGIIYKNGYGKEIEKNIGFAIEYFKEAINLKNDVLSIYNFSQIFIFEESIKNDLDKAIEMLIKPFANNFVPNKELLCLALIKKFGFNLEQIKKFVEELTTFPYDLINMIQSQNLLNHSIFEKRCNYYQNINYMYNNLYEIILSNYNNQENNEQKYNENNINNISQSFYDGFSI